MKEKKERKLTRAEEKRKEAFDALGRRLAMEGYTQKLLGISEEEMNARLLPVTVPVIAPCLAVYFFAGNPWDLEIGEFFLAFLLYFFLIIVHEGLHGITWAFFAKEKWRSISFGVIPASMVAYCHCSEPLKKHQIVLGSLMPTIILGLGFAAAAILSGSAMLMLTAVLNILGGGGDLLIVLKILTYRSDAASILLIDHPYEIGTAVFEK